MKSLNGLADGKPGVKLRPAIHHKIARSSWSGSVIDQGAAILGNNSPLLSPEVKQDIFLVNRSSYTVFMDRWFPHADGYQISILLNLISFFVDITGPSPVLLSELSESGLEAFNAILRKSELQSSDQAFEAFISGFLKFFDFPLRMPGARLLSLAGSLELVALPTQRLSPEDFANYHLSASFSVPSSIPGKAPKQLISRYQWDSKSSITQNTLAFNFKDRYTTDAISNPVTVTLTGYDDTESWSKDFNASDPSLQNLRITVGFQAPPVITPRPSPSGGIQDPNKKIKGKVVSLSDTPTLIGTVLIQAKVKSEDSWRVVSTGVSDKAGNFAMPYPYGRYSSAQALTSLDRSSLTAITVNQESMSESISDNFLYVLLQRPQNGKPKSEDCGCNATTAAGRLPSQDELIRSDQYTQDIGGTCMNFTIPNRTLREFNYTAIVRNTDPDVANYSLTSTETIDPDTGVMNVNYQLISQCKVSRRNIDLDNPIKWEDISGSVDETLYEAVTISTGHVLHYKSEFRADGYSLGDLLYALPLAPGQKKEIVILDSNHLFQGSESQGLSQQEQLRNDLLSERDIVDQIAGNIGERLSGSSEANTAGISGSAGAAAGGSGWGATIGVAGGTAKSTSSANQDSARNMVGYFSEVLKQGLHQNASSYRRKNTSVVTTSQEAQQYQVETTVVANHNHCHSLTIMHYEVLRHFAIYHELVDVEECVFIPFPLTKFAMDNICKWADILATKLLPLNANTYIDLGSFANSGYRHPLVPAFDALERVRTDWALVDWPTGRYDEEPILWLEGEISIRTDIPRPKTRYDMIKAFSSIPKQYLQDVGNWVLGIVTGGLSLLVTGSNASEAQVRQDLYTKFFRLDANYQNKRPADAMRLYNLSIVSAPNSSSFDPVEFFANTERDRSQWIAYATVLGKSSDLDGLRELLSGYFLETTVSEWDSIWRDRVAPDIYKAIFESIMFKGIHAQDFTQLSRYRGSQSIMRVNFNGSAGSTRKNTTFITLKCVRDAVRALANYSIEFNLAALRVTYVTQHYRGLLYNGGVNNDLFDGVTVYCPETAAEQRNPRTDDRWRAQKLIKHLNRNLEYYNRVLLYSLDAQRRFMLLDGFHMEVYFPDGKPAGFHSLSSVLKNQPVGMAGNSMVFPVSPGYKVDRSFIIKIEDRDSTSNPLLDFYKPDSPPPPYRMSIPTKGVYSESMMGACDSCEKVKANSSQDWTKFNTDEATPINAVTPPTPEVTTYNPSTKDFSTPIVSIQNAPTAPSPGAGLAGVTDVLAKAGIFKDITGLDANQRSAMEAYLGNTEAASAASGRALASMATNLSAQSHNTKNSPSIMGTIQQAQESGLITPAEAAQLVKQHIQSQIDGGASQKAQIEQNKEASKPSIARAAVAAVQGNKAVDATIVDGEGNQSSIKVTPAKAPVITLAKVTPPVPPIGQKMSMVCWAAAATMLASWKEGKILRPEDALVKAGQAYVDQYNSNGGLVRSQKADFVAKMGMVFETPASYAPSHFVALMNTFGPLWITIDDSAGPLFSPHAKILIQIDGDGKDDGSNTTFSWLDPARIAGGPRMQSFKDFIVSYEEMVTDQAGKLFTQIVHFTDEIQQEGYDVGEPFNALTAVHESLVLSALMGSSIDPLNKETTVNEAPAEVHEILRGVYWNDDPACQHFDDKKDDNWDFSSGANWLLDFDNGTSGKPYDNQRIIPRSHCWDLQFLHAMGSALGEDPHDTVAKMMLWLEIMWRVATGDMDASTKISDVNVKTQFGAITHTLGEFFTSTSKPKITDTIFALLTANTEYEHVNIRRRALGSCFHLLQDSYARGHTLRELRNPQDSLSWAEGTFKPGKYAQLGDVVNFHTYIGQGDDRASWDHWNKKAWGEMQPAVPQSWNPLWGARMARDKGVELAEFWNKTTKWENGEKQFFEGVFKLADNARPSDNATF